MVIVLTIYDRIRQLRIEKNMSQDDLAHAIGYKDRSMITKIELGKVDISQKKILEFARVLGTTPAWLMGWTEEQQNDSYSVPEPVTTCEARIISSGIDKMPEERRRQALAIMQAAFTEYADFFKEETDSET